MDRTFVICKPDAVERGLVGEIIGRFERKGLRIVALELRTLDNATLARHYAEHAGKPFYDDLVQFMSRGPAVVLVLEGPADTYKVVRGMMGATNPRDAAPGTIRGSYGRITTKGVYENVIHASSDGRDAEREIKLWFQPDDIVIDNLYPTKEITQAQKKIRTWA